MQEHINLIVILLVTLVVAVGIFMSALAGLLGYAVGSMSTIKHPGLLPVGRLPYKKRCERAWLFQKAYWLGLVGLQPRPRREKPVSHSNEWDPRVLIYWLYHKGFFSPAAAAVAIIVMVVLPFVGLLVAGVTLSYLILDGCWRLGGLFEDPQKRWLLVPVALAGAFLLLTWVLMGTSKFTAFIGFLLLAWATSLIVRSTFAGLLEVALAAAGYLRPIYRFVLKPVGHAVLFVVESFGAAELEARGDVCIGCAKATFLPRVPDFGPHYSMPDTPQYYPCEERCQKWYAEHGVSETHEQELTAKTA